MNQIIYTPIPNQDLLNPLKDVVKMQQEIIISIILSLDLLGVNTDDLLMQFNLDSQS